MGRRGLVLTQSRRGAEKGAKKTTGRPKIVGIGRFASGLPDLGSNKKRLQHFGR